jgi:hypothetical protein
MEAHDTNTLYSISKDKELWLDPKCSREITVAANNFVSAMTDEYLVVIIVVVCCHWMVHRRYECKPWANNTLLLLLLPLLVVVVAVGKYKITSDKQQYPEK